MAIGIRKLSLEVVMCVKALESSMESNDTLKACMARLVPTYRYEPEFKEAVGAMPNVHVKGGKKTQDCNAELEIKKIVIDIMRNVM